MHGVSFRLIAYSPVI